MINSINNNIPSNQTNLDNDPVRILPEEISVKIFSYFSPEELGRNCLVRKLWCRLASDPTLWNAFLKTHFPKVSVFDESDWNAHVDLSAHGLSVADAPPVDKRKDYSILKKLLPSLSIEGNAGVTDLTIPKGLTVIKLANLADSRNDGDETVFPYYWTEDRAYDEIGNVPVDRTYRILITNNILQGSRSLAGSEQKNLVHRIGCEMPTGLEAITLLVVTFMSSGKRLLGINPPTYTRCLSEIDDFQVIVGRFDPEDGIDIDYLNIIVSSIGVSAVQKF